MQSRSEPPPRTPGPPTTRAHRFCAALLCLGLVACSASTDDKTRPPPTDTADASVDLTSDTAGDSAYDAELDPSDDLPNQCDLQRLEPGQEPFVSLSEYCFFVGETRDHNPQPEVVLYEVNAPLYSDRTVKSRFIVLPPDEAIDFDAEEPWTYPEGTVLIKTFAYPIDATDLAIGLRLLETRLLVLRDAEWTPYVYIWDDDQGDAHLFKTGKWLNIDRIDRDSQQVTSTYRVPNTNQCKSCHGQNDRLRPLGPRTRQLNRMTEVDGQRINQLSHFAQRGMFSADIGPTESLPHLAQPFGNADLEDRARAYLETNCAHCHNPGGAGGPSGLNLGITVEEPIDYGVCRRPVAAGGGAGGRPFDISPGSPEHSIIVFRMSATDPNFKMPELPTVTSDEDGVELVTSWIAGMTLDACE
jgi:uncharacterized repeat protein (TIGR03806 family)